MTATAPQITPIRTPRVASPLNHSTPRLTNSVTTINTPMDNSTVAANLERILNPLAAYYASACGAPNPHRCRERISLSDRSLHRCRPSTLLFGEGLAQLPLLLFGQTRRDDLEVVGLEFVYHLIERRNPAGQGKQCGGALRDLLAHLPDEIVVDADLRQGTAERASPDTEGGHEEDRP